VRIDEPTEEPEIAPSRVVAQVGHNLDVWALAWNGSGNRVATGGFETRSDWNDKGAAHSCHRED
jgi:hypothetical protein